MKILRKIECWWNRQHRFCWYAANGEQAFGVCLNCGKVIEEDEDD
jgi:Fe2+ or Zn2+ uptake regulation protein